MAALVAAFGNWRGVNTGPYLNLPAFLGGTPGHSLVEQGREGEDGSGDIDDDLHLLVGTFVAAVQTEVKKRERVSSRCKQSTRRRETDVVSRALDASQVGEN